MFNNNGNIMRSAWTAQPRGQSGVVCTDLFPKLAELVDDLAVLIPKLKPADDVALLVVTAR